MEEKTLSEVIEMAIQREIEAYNFYQDLRGKVDDENARETILWIAGEEKKHREFLEQYRDGEYGPEALRMNHPVNYKIAEHQEEPEVSGDISRQNVFLIAAHREARSTQFYSELADMHPDGELKQALLKMASEELRHKEKMEYLYTNTAFPQTDGG